MVLKKALKSLDCARLTLLLFLLSVQNCFNFSTFHSAEVLEKGHQSITLAYSRVHNTGSEDIRYINSFLCMGRYGWGHHTEAGVALMITYPLTSGITGDFKYQFMREPLKGAVDLGGTYSGFLILPESKGVVIFHPAILFSTTYLYFGYKWNAASLLSERWVDDDNRWTYFSTFILGSTFGNRLQLLPEISLHIHAPDLNKPIIAAGIGLCYQFNQLSK